MAETSPLSVQLHAIRTAIIGVALAVITTGLIIQGEPLDFAFFILTLAVCSHSFVSPLVRG